MPASLLGNEAALRFGSQCVVACIDAARTQLGHEVMAAFGTRHTGMLADRWAERLAASGAGEILIQSVERDGTLEGYDLDLCRLVSRASSVPVLVCCGAGNWRHFEDGLALGGADGVCTQNIFHFTEASIVSAKKYLRSKSIPVRL